MNVCGEKAESLFMTMTGRGNRQLPLPRLQPRQVPNGFRNQRQPPLPPQLGDNSEMGPDDDTDDWC